MTKKQDLERRGLDNGYLYKLHKEAEFYMTRNERRNLIKLYSMFGVRGKERAYNARAFECWDIKNKFGYSLTAARHARDVMYDYMTSIRQSRRDSRPDPSTMKFKFAVVTGGGYALVGNRAFESSSHVKWFANRISEWRPKLVGILSTVMAKHTRDNQIDLGNNKVYQTPSIAKLRRLGAAEEGDKFIPLVATDKFILKFYDNNGNQCVPDKISDGDSWVVDFISDDSKPKVKRGVLVKYATEFGCSLTLTDATKAAKMKAVRKAKKALGLA